MTLRDLNPYDVDFWKRWDNKELNFNMTPINFIGDKNKKETYVNHLKHNSRETRKARKTIPCELDISYGKSEYEKMDVYGTDLPHNAPSFLWIHGGYWRAGDRNWSGPFLSSFYSWGFRSFVIDYPLAPEYRMMDMCRGVYEGITKAMSLFPESTFFLGAHSAGSQLLSTMLYKVPNLNPLQESYINRIKGFILISATYDMRPALYMPKVNNDLKLTEDEALDFSAILRSDWIHSGWLKNSNSLKFIIIYGQSDPPSLQLSGEIFADMLRKKSFWSEYWIDQESDHFSIIDNLSNAESAISKKLKHFLLRESLTRQVKL